MSVRPCNLFTSTNWLSLISLPQTCRSVSIYIYILGLWVWWTRIAVWIHERSIGWMEEKTFNCRNWKQGKRKLTYSFDKPPGPNEVVGRMPQFQEKQGLKRSPKTIDSYLTIADFQKFSETENICTVKSSLVAFPGTRLSRYRFTLPAGSVLHFDEPGFLWIGRTMR